MIDGKITEQVTEFNYLGSKISEYKKKTWNTNYKHTRESMEL
jgi:hypothetical protein